MRIIIALAAIGAASSASHADAPARRQLPKRCVADSPIDSPCAAVPSTYRLRIEPVEHDDRCFITKPIETQVWIGKPLQYGLVQLRANDLVKKLRWKQRKDDDHKASADIRDGVCCIDVRLTQTTGKPNNETERRLIVHLAAGGSVVNATAQERIMPDHGDDCQNRLVVVAKRVE